MVFTSHQVQAIDIVIACTTLQLFATVFIMLCCYDDARRHMYDKKGGTLQHPIELNYEAKLFIALSD